MTWTGNRAGTMGLLRTFGRWTMYSSKFASSGVVYLQSMKVDKYGLTTVELSKVCFKDEPFSLANQSHQVFYLEDLSDKNLHIAMHGKRKIVGVDNVVDEDEYKMFEEAPSITQSIRDMID